MTPAERNIVKSLIAVAWADGKFEGPESGVIEGLLSGFDASDQEEAELLAYARTPRTLEHDIPLDQLSEEDRELLLANAALLAHLDGEAHAAENTLLVRLGALLQFDEGRVRSIVKTAADGVLNLRSRSRDSEA